MNQYLLNRGGLARALILLALLGLVSACGKTNPTLEELLASGKAAQAARRHNAAIIEFRNVIQRKPAHAEAHYLLAVEYQRIGDAPSAEAEFRYALVLDYDRMQIAAPLGKVMLEQGKFDELLDEPDVSPDAPSSLRAELMAQRGVAQFALGQRDQAAAMLAKALEIQPGSPDALMGQARVALADGHLDLGAQLIDQAIASSPDNVEAWTMNAYLRRQRKQDGALEAFAKAIELDPENIPVRMSVVSMHMSRGDLEDAENALGEARKFAPRSALVAYMAALMEFRKGNHPEASRSIRTVLQVLPDDLPSLALAGVIELAMGAPAQAVAFLTRAVERNPNSVFARRLLAGTFAESGNPERGLDVLRPALAAAPNDPTLLWLAGDLALRNNDPRRASEFFERASRVDPGSATLRTGLAASRLALGDVDRALADLEAAIQLDKRDYQADVMLAMAHLRKGQYDSMLKALDSLEAKQPRNPLTHNLRGVAYFATGDIDNARKALDRALELQPNYAPAILNLAQLDLGQNDAGAARRRLESLLEREPDNIQVLIALAELAPRLGATSAEQIAWLERAHKNAPAMTKPRLMLARRYAQDGDFTKALTFASEARAADPDSVEAVETLANIQWASGDRRRALDSYDKLVALDPGSPVHRYRLANAQTVSGDYFAAKQSLQKALDMRPDYLDAMALLVAVEIERGSPTEAMKVARDIQKLAPKSPTGYRLEGDVLMAEKKFLPAARSYEAAYAIEKSGALVMKMHAAYKDGGKPDVAEARLAKWLDASPEDLPVRMYAAQVTLASGKYQDAAAKYEWLQQKVPDNVVVLNNLAWAYQELKDARALPTAQRAYALKPDFAGVLDTYGWILVQQGEIEQGIKLLRTAVASAPREPAIRFHLAQGLVKAGDRANARRELEAVLSSERAFAQTADATALLEQLKD